MAIELPAPEFYDNLDGNVGEPPARVARRVGPHHATEHRRSQKTSERVALDIVHDIVAQGFRVGDRLPLEAEMVEQYQVSRASLREGSSDNATSSSSPTFQPMRASRTAFELCFASSASKHDHAIPREAPNMASRDGVIPPMCTGCHPPNLRPLSGARP